MTSTKTFTIGKFTITIRQQAADRFFVTVKRKGSTVSMGRDCTEDGIAGFIAEKVATFKAWDDEFRAAILKQLA